MKEFAEQITAWLTSQADKFNRLAGELRQVFGENGPVTELAVLHRKPGRRATVKLLARRHKSQHPWRRQADVAAKGRISDHVCAIIDGLDAEFGVKDVTAKLPGISPKTVCTAMLKFKRNGQVISMGHGRYKKTAKWGDGMNETEKSYRSMSEELHKAHVDDK